MFRKTRQKIIISVTTALVLFLAVTLATIYLSNYFSLKSQNQQMLEEYVAMYSLDEMLNKDPHKEGPPPGEQSDGAPPADLPEKPVRQPPDISNASLFQLSDFYSAAIASDGEVLAYDVGKSGLYQESDIAELADAILALGKDSGMYGTLLYRIDHRDKYTLVAFMDTTLTKNSLNKLFANTLIAGIISICIFFAISVFLARKIVQPLEENDRRQKQFVSDAGHELKTPVAVISANAELLSRQYGENQWLSNICYENERMGSLIRDLLDLSHAENSTAVHEALDFSRLVEQEALSFESVAFEHGLLLNTDLQSGITVNGSRSQLAQLVSILIDNAISYSRGGKEIGITLKKDHKNVLLTVSNPGEELSEETKAKLFDRFYRLDEARTGNEGHFGLGLPIAKAVTEAHKGSIHADSADGQVVFSVSLPAENEKTA